MYNKKGEEQKDVTKSNIYLYETRQNLTYYVFLIRTYTT